MTTMSLHISMSLDGYIAAPHRQQEVPLGENGERLHEWAFSDDAVGREVPHQGDRVDRGGDLRPAHVR